MLPRLDSIKPARLKIGLTQHKLASLTGVSTSMINQIESGRCQSSYATAKIGRASCRERVYVLV